MRILNINQSDRSGGAAIAAFRHNEAMRLSGYDAKMLVIKQVMEQSADILTPNIPWICSILQSWFFNGLSYRKIKKNHPYASWTYASHGFNLAAEKIVQDADIIVLHWVNHGMLSLKGIKQILELQKPTYWFMHDMWPITGGCHYSLDCDRYMSECGFCPMFNGNRNYKDASFQQLKRKEKLWKEYDNLRILAPSQWLANCIKRSKLFANKQVLICRNFIDTDLYKPIDKFSARRLLNLPLDKKLILFGADSIKSPYKGWHFLKEALSMFSDDIECVVFGSTDIKEQFSCKVHFIGKIADDYSLVLIYNACDVFVTPSITDNYPNVLVEAMACGLPCVGYGIGGIPEIIEDRQTGYVAVDISSESLSKGISWVLYNSDYTRLCVESRNKILQQSSYAACVHNNIYDKVFI